MKYIKRKCEICNSEFERKITKSRPKPKFCSQICRNNYFASFKKSVLCKWCNKSFFDKHNGDRKYCSHNCYWCAIRELNKVIEESSYLQAREDGKRKYSHRIIVEEYIGRKLNSSEIVHHINGDKADNRIENLQVMTQSEHIKIHLHK